MSIRLNKTMKEDLIRNYRTSVYESKRKELKEGFDQIGLEIYSYFMKKFPQNHKIEELPRSWFPLDQHIYFLIPDHSTVQHCSLPFSLKIPNFLTYGSKSNVKVEATLKDEKLVQAYNDKAQEIDKCAKDWHEFVIEARKVLNPIRTTKQLQEVWPESVPFWPKEFHSQKNLPQVQTETVNKMLENLK